MVGWHQRLNGQEFEQALGIGDGQGILAFSSLWGHKESDMTEATQQQQQQQQRGFYFFILKKVFFVKLKAI